MFGSKEIGELKEEVNKKFEELKSNYIVQTETHNQAITELKAQISELLQSKKALTEQITKDLHDINRLKSEFEISLNRLESTQRTIEDRASSSIKEELLVETLSNTLLLTLLLLLVFFPKSVFLVGFGKGLGEGTFIALKGRLSLSSTGFEGFGTLEISFIDRNKLLISIEGGFIVPCDDVPCEGGEGTFCGTGALALALAGG